MKSWAAKLFLAVMAVPVAGCGQAASPSGDGPLFPCDDPGPVLIDGKETGFEFCTAGPIHRAKVQTCPSKLPRKITCIAEAGPPGPCTVDADCIERPNGLCQLETFGSGMCGCNYGCTTDAECGKGNICLCGDPVGRCVQASCITDAECGKGLCTPYVPNPGCNDTGFACQTALDECATEQDCKEGTQCTIENGHRVCHAPTCAF